MGNKSRCPTLDMDRSMFVTALLIGMFLSTQGYCADISAEAQQIDEVTTSVMNMLFSPGIKKAALAIGAGSGVFQAWMSGSIKPLLLWGGLGMAVNYVPKVVEMISKL